MTFSRRSIHSQRASSSTCTLFSFGIALKSKLSRLLVAGIEPLWRHWFKPNGEGGLDTALDHAPFAVDQFQLDQAGQELDVVPAFGRALAGMLVVFPQECRQLEGLEVMGEQDLRGVGHCAASEIC
jgi:hypothetical protein